MKKTILSLALILFCVCLLAACAQSEGQGASIEETISLEQYDFVMDEIVFLDSVEYIEPEAGKVYLAVRFHYTNTTEETQKYTTMPQVQLTDEDGNEYEIDYEAANIYALSNGIDFNLMQDALEPNAVRYDAEVYLVPVADVDKELVVSVLQTSYYYSLSDVERLPLQTEDNVEDGSNE